MFKMVLLQFLYGLSDRDMEEQAAFNLVYKWFLGLSAEEAGVCQIQGGLHTPNPTFYLQYRPNLTSFLGLHSCIRHFVASYLFDKKKVPLPVISRLLRHKGLQTTEIFLQAIDPNFREAMRLLEGNVMGLLQEMDQKNLLTEPTHRLAQKERVQVFEP
jgi:hypothetical protein